MAEAAEGIASHIGNIKGIFDLISHGAKTGADALTVSSDAADKILTQHQDRINSMIRTVGIILAVCCVCAFIIICCSSLVGGGGILWFFGGKKKHDDK